MDCRLLFFLSSGCAFRVPSSSVLVEIENFRLLLLLYSEYHITYTMRLYNVHDVLYFIESLAMDNGRLKLQNLHTKNLMLLPIYCEIQVSNDAKTLVKSYL